MKFLVQGLQTCVHSTKRAGREFPSVAAVQGMLDSVLAVSKLAQDLKTCLVQPIAQSGFKWSTTLYRLTKTNGDALTRLFLLNTMNRVSLPFIFVSSLHLYFYCILFVIDWLYISPSSPPLSSSLLLSAVDCRSSLLSVGSFNVAVDYVI